MKSIILFVLTVLISPLFAAIILKVKAFFAGRKGPSIFINYYTLIKLFKYKSSVYSETTTFIFRMSVIISFSVITVVLMFFPFGGVNSIFSFKGDMIFIIYLMALGRFFTILAALDTGSAFEGMGASREAYFSIIAELTLFMTFIFIQKITGTISFSKSLSIANGMNLWGMYGASLMLIIISLFMILLTENSRIPVDDHATHLELTMIHEVMVLDHSGPELGLIHLGANMKLMFYSVFIARLIVPFSFRNFWVDIIVFYIVVALIYLFIGIVESIMARFRFTKVPKYILTSFALVFFANIIILGRLK
ncbi:respiratory chain complex I subunit 1 family protein [Haliovirga abyssi]|uniref:Hydrogenase n=1 Tax=Haliovirga abyssi TaxID=2996794 RepID=A0AAU9D9Y3_9FUSO|nr:NADH-quinone oxidoreductase subunit H [Haliovirga abyssi]BDU51453.1 hydrogenase [Haliovirga abyssi]